MSEARDLSETTLCRACGNAVPVHAENRRSEVKFCSNACRQRAYRRRLTVGRAGAASTVGLLEQMGSFVGRVDELVDLARFIRDVRMVTLTGAPGVGKSRLAVEAAAQEQRRARHKVIHVALATVGDRGQVLSMIESALYAAGRDDPGDGQAWLLLLDDCEHVLSECSHGVNNILSRHPALRVLATSREPLRLPGEVVYSVAGLAWSHTVGHGGAATAERAPAVRLFVERAAAVMPGFELTDDNVDDVSEVCTRLDGLPLMIELAALLVRAFPVAEIARRLDDRMNLLTTGWATADPRHQSLRAALDWSYDRLSTQERAMLRTVSVLADEFGVDAAAAVAGDASTGITHAAVPELLAALESKSLIMSAGEHCGEARFRMTETVRCYGREHLVREGEETQVHERLVDWIIGTTGAFPRTAILDRVTADGLKREQRNVLSALGWLTERNDDRRLLLAAVADAVDLLHGDPPAARGRAADAVDGMDTGRAYRGVALATAAFVAGAAGSYSEAKAFASQALTASAMSPHDPLNGRMALMLYLLPDGPVHRMALAELQARLRLSSRLGDLVITALCLYVHAHELLSAVDRAQRAGQAAEVLALARSQGLPGPVRVAQFVTGTLLLEDGRSDEAAACFAGLLRDTGDGADFTRAMEGLALVAMCAQQRDRGLTLLTVAGAAGPPGPLTKVAWWRERLATAAAAARDALPLSAVTAAIELGETLRDAEAVRYALHSTSKPVAKSTERQLLSQREHEIATLVAKGLTNRQIAARLYLSVRTVETHLRNIRTTRGLNTRAHLAAWYSGTHRAV